LKYSEGRAPFIIDGVGYVRLASGETALFSPEDMGVVSEHLWCLMGNGYASFTQYGDGGKRTVKMHYLIVGKNADHKNGNRLDNRRENLRLASTSQNSANRRAKAGASSEYKGVCWDKSRGKWMAAIQVSGKTKTLGRFDDEAAAARAYDAAAAACFGEFAKLNFKEIVHD